jgi:CRP-like cAMP-binding protein
MKSGYVRAYSKAPFGENTLNIFKPLFLISVIHFFTSSKNDLYLRAITSAEIYIVPKQEFKKLLDKNPDVSALIMDFFFGSLLLYLTNQGNIINGSAINKVASVLLQMAHDYGNEKNGQLIVNFPATHRIVASLIGLPEKPPASK